MENALMEGAIGQGVWAILSIFLIFYILKAQEKRDQRQEEREKNYQDIIEQMTEKLNIVEVVKQDVDTIKKHVIKKFEKKLKSILLNLIEKHSFIYVIT
ncbi:BhlA/UviB family holin-like peptide [Clostridium sulfidigenes]|uniref:BhlA/UviB family holin-like peptide n=1 Tax=Clostridium sulfidigenes TaxID=318464 RepID=UPI0006924807|nr:BhlA/UviB family holin-like peptide [Clostridium sulfidigenes]